MITDLCQCKLDLNGRKDHGDRIGDWNLSLEILLIISRSEKASRLMPVFKEGNGFWYIYYVMAHDQSGGGKRSRERAMCIECYWTLARTTTLMMLNMYVPFMTNKVSSRLSTRGAFGPETVHGNTRGQLQIWGLEYPPDQEIGHDKY